MKRILQKLVVILFFIASVTTSNAQLKYAGLRSSVYGFNPFPDSSYFYNVTKDMANKFDNNQEASLIWIIGYTSNNGCYLNFPKPDNNSYSNIYFANRDFNEKYLTQFDKNGIKVWLQIEPGFANIEDIIDLVLSQYGHHSSIIGFGVDVEWYRTSSSNNYEGESVSDSLAEVWYNKVASFNPGYKLFTKHWLISKMPPTYRKGMTFVDDSQIFNSLDEMLNEYSDWGKAFSTADVAFQFGYDSDKKWWSKFDDPPKTIGEAIINNIPNTSSLYWVDFTAYDIWEKDFTTFIEKQVNPYNLEFKLHQNYPNPFNPTTNIAYTLRTSGFVKIIVYNSIGKKVATLVNKYQTAGRYNISWNSINSSNQKVSSGVYFYKIIVNNKSDTKKMLLLQ